MKTLTHIIASIIFIILPATLTANTHKFTPTAPIPAGTVAHSAVSLPNGNILVTGGYNVIFDKIPIASNLARIFSHKTHKWRIAKGQLNFGRLNHASITIPATTTSKSTKVLIVGGISQGRKALKSIEIFDLKTEQFQLLPPMSIARKSPKLNHLPNGKILITGQSQTAEILEPTPSSPSGYTIRPAVHKSYTNHSDHATVTMPDGSVILFGGRTTHIERFDPITERFTLYKTRLPMVYDDQAAILLYNNTILLIGGQEVYSNRCTNRTWIFNPKTGILTNGPTLKPQPNFIQFSGISDVAAIDLMANNKAHKGKYILICGGEDDPGKGKGPKFDDITLNSAWVYDATTNTFNPVGPMINPHDDFAAAPLPAKNNQAAALIIAGYNSNDKFQANCEIFQYTIDP